MRLDLYQAKTARIAAEQTALLEEAYRRRLAGQNLSALEQSGVLHAWQVLIENCIGKAKHLLKAKGEPVPASAYDAFSTLNRLGLVSSDGLPQRQAIIGLRNRIVRDYMDIDLAAVMALVDARRYLFLRDFLLASIVH